MKRLLAYLFIVLGLGLSVSVNVNADVKRPICVSVGIPNYYVFTPASCKASMQYVIYPTHSLYDYYNNQNFNKSINELNKKDTIFLIDQLKKGRTYKYIKKTYSLNKKQINLLRKIKIKNETKNINKYVKILNQGKSLEYFFLEKVTLDKVFDAKTKLEEKNISKYVKILNQGKSLDNFFLEKVTLDKVVDAKTKLEEKNISKYVAILSKGEKLDKYFLEKTTIPKVIKLKILTEEKNIDKYLEANLKGSDLSEFYLENETIELVKAKRQERREALYAKTCTGWIFGHKKGTFEWFKCLEEKEQKELFQGSETKIVKNIENKKTKSEKIIKTTSTDNEAPILQVVEILTVTDPRYTIEGKVTDKGSDKVYLKVDGQDIPLNKGKFKINRYSPVDENIKITAIDKWGNEVTKIIKVSVNLENTTIAETLQPLNASKIRTKSSNNKVALIIGIENYTEAPKANYANLDAKYFYDYAIKAFGVKKQNINLLVDENATFVKTDKALSLWLKTKIKANQSDLIIFFAGHGLASSDGKSLYLLPQDGNPDRLNRSAFSRSELFQTIIDLKPNSVTMFLDTCYSGVSRDEQMLLASARPIRIVADDQEGIPDNFTIFTASKLDQISSGLKEAEHGIFSYYLMKGLEGKADSNKDKKITNGELLAYMDENVSQKASELGRQQNPSLAGDPDKILMSYR